VLQGLPDIAPPEKSGIILAIRVPVKNRLKNKETHFSRTGGLAGTAQPERVSDSSWDMLLRLMIMLG